MSTSPITSSSSNALPASVDASTKTNSTVSRGVGATPTTLQSVSPKENISEGKPYIERALFAIKDFFVFIVSKITQVFSKIISYFTQKTKPSQEQQTPQSPSNSVSDQDSLIKAPAKQELALLTAFKRLDSSCQEGIYRLIGRTWYNEQSVWRSAKVCYMFRSFTAIGKGLVEKDPNCLQPYINT